MTKSKTVSNSVSTSNGNSISIPADSAGRVIFEKYNFMYLRFLTLTFVVLAMAVAKEYEYIGQRVSAEYTINCNGKIQKEYGKVDIRAHTFHNVDSGKFNPCFKICATMYNINKY